MIRQPFCLLMLLAMAGLSLCPVQAARAQEPVIPLDPQVFGTPFVRD